MYCIGMAFELMSHISTRSRMQLATYIYYKTYMCSVRIMYLHTYVILLCTYTPNNNGYLLSLLIVAYCILSIPAVPSFLFQLRLGRVKPCAHWTVSVPSSTRHTSAIITLLWLLSSQDDEAYGIEQAIKETMVEAIRSQCDECNFTAASIGTGEFSCQTTASQVIYRSTLVAIETHTAKELREFAEDWVSSGPTIPYRRLRLRVRTDCPFLISSLEEPECLPGGISRDVCMNRCAEVCLAQTSITDRLLS